jgi:hypothetical protein
VQVTAATATHCPISQAVPAPQVGVHCSGTHCPALQVLPAPQKSWHVFSVELLHAASAVASRSAGESSLSSFKVRSFPDQVGGAAVRPGGRRAPLEHGAYQRPGGALAARSARIGCAQARAVQGETVRR